MKLYLVSALIAVGTWAGVQQDEKPRSKAGEALQYEAHVKQQLETARQQLQSLTGQVAEKTALIERLEVAMTKASEDAQLALAEYLQSLQPQVPPQTWEPGPDFSAAPFAALMPQFPQYRIPKLEDCEWIIENGVAVSTKGLPSISMDSEQAVCGTAYRASLAAGHELPITFGVKDNAGPAVLGGQWNPDAARSITQRDGSGGWLGLSVEFLGLDEQCEVNVGWATGDWGRTDYIGLFNIGLRGMPNHHIIVANKPHGKSILDGCWFLNHSVDGMYNSGLHTANWDLLVVRRMKARGERPSDPGPKFREHWCYFKSGGPMWIVENQMQGANGTCFQVRPGADDPGNSKCWGPIVAAYNNSDSYGFEWGNTPETSHGGSAMSFWSSPDFPIFVYKNRITNARYGCLAVSNQPVSPFEWAPGVDRNWYNDRGYPIGAVYIADNVFSNPLSERDPVSISGCESVHVWSSNSVMNGRWIMNSQWSAERGFTYLRIGTIKTYGQMPDFWTWDREQRVYKVLKSADFRQE